MKMRRIVKVLLLMSIVPTTAITIIAIRGCDTDRMPDGWPDHEGLHKDPGAEVLSESKQALIDQVLALQRRAGDLEVRARAEPGQSGAIAREIEEVRAQLSDTEKQIVTLTPAKAVGAQSGRPEIQEQLSRLDERLDRAERSL